MARMWLNVKTYRLYGWKASKYCVLVDDSNENDRLRLIKLGLLKPKNVSFNVCENCGEKYTADESREPSEICINCLIKINKKR